MSFMADGQMHPLLGILQDLVINGTVEEIRDILAFVPANLLRNDQLNDYYLLLSALEKQRINVALYLLDHGFRVHMGFHSFLFRNKRKTPLHYAVEMSNLSLIETLLDKGALYDIGKQDENGQTPMYLAIKRNQIDIIQLFLSKVRVARFSSLYLLHYAIEQNKPEIIELFIQTGLSLTKMNDNDETPFCIAIKKNSQTILDLMWSSVDIARLGDCAKISLTYVASITGNIDFLKKSICTGFPINRLIHSSPDDWFVLKNLDECSLLCLAVKHLQLETVKFLLKNGADLTKGIHKGLSPLQLAASAKIENKWENQVQLESNDQIIEEILKACVKMRVNLSNAQKVVYFSIACMRDQPNVIEYFLQNGVRVNQSILLNGSLYDGGSPLHLAAQYDCTKNLEMLLEYGANVNHKGFRKYTPLHVASQEASIETIELFVKHGASVFNEDDCGDTPIHLAFKKKRYEILDFLLSIEQVTSSNPRNNKGISHFHIACTRNNINTIESFIKNGVDVNECVPTLSIKAPIDNILEWHGYSPLHFAASFNKSRIVQLLLKNNADVKIKDARGFTPLHLACEYTCNKFAELIEDSLVSYQDFQKQYENCTNTDDKMKKNENQRSSKSWKIIDWSANRKEHIKIINLLIKYKSNVNCLDNFGNGPLYYSCHFQAEILLLESELRDEIFTELTKEIDTRRNLIINILLQASANPNICYKNSSILHFICLSDMISDEKKIELTELFLQNGSDVNARNREMQTPLHCAVRVMNKKLVILLLNYNADVDSVDWEKCSPLHLATSYELCDKSAQIIKILIDKKPNVNMKELQGFTPLHNLASQHLSNCSEIESLILSLIKIGADVNAVDSIGKTPLFNACWQMNKAVDVLITYGADINIEDCHGKNVLYYIYKYQAKPVYQSNRFLDDDLISMLETLYNHLIKLTTIGLYVSKKVLFMRAKLRIILRSNLFHFLQEDEEKKVSECQAEMEVMKTTKIDSKYSLFDIIFKDEHSMTKHIKKVELIKIIQSDDFYKTFPIYGSFLESKCIKATKKYLCMPIAKVSLNFLFGIYLPDVCSESILQYLDYFELRAFLDSFYLVISETRRSENRMPLRVRKSNTKYQKVN